MRITKRLATVALVGAMAVGTVAVAPAANAGGYELGTTSLAEVLGNDLVPGNGFDKNWSDFDIVREAADAVIVGKPGTPVALLADGSVALTAFIPNDRAFQKLARDLGFGAYLSEKKTFAALATLGVDTLETVLLYHVVAGTIDSSAALAADGESVTTVQGGAFTVRVKSTDPLVIKLKDADPNNREPVDRPRGAGHQQGQPADRPRHRPGPAPDRPAELNTHRLTA